ncbi:methyltransferase domain-containing protein [Trichlorobacter lovleyi]|uniref:Methyltransferase type 11 n=1 Tax=Trichlorobacter lovleyi (strain ATCC BAA-1151 / DSM 17278 / SZ) TaxID=398767 RepID=B3E3I9_TRIL1|nr:methyltransferase domain-containing protein [Trichlorobacter lovleyi]ACD95808.1 Methyltransferase type 11 [Trichlorobacter lovleyi SZ]
MQQIAGDDIQRELKLDIACGKNKRPGFVGVDLWEGADIVVDLWQFPWPFEDNSVDEVFCSHYIEHTPDLIAFINELYRIMKVGAKAEIIAPYYSSIRAWQDPTHLRAISEATFYYFSKKWRLINRLDHYPLTVDFNFDCNLLLDPYWQEKSEEEKKFAIRHYVNAVSDIQARLIKREHVDESLYLAEIASECWELGQFVEAIRFCEQLLERDMAGVDEYLMMADFYQKNDKFAKAFTMYRSALKFDNESFQAHCGLIRLLGSAGKVKKAQQYLENIRKTNQELADLIQGLL